MKFLLPCYALVSRETGRIMLTGGGMPITSHNKYVIEESLRRLSDYDDNPQAEIRALPPTPLMIEEDDE